MIEVHFNKLQSASTYLPDRSSCPPVTSRIVDPLYRLQSQKDAIILSKRPDRRFTFHALTRHHSIPFDCLAADSWAICMQRPTVSDPGPPILSVVINWDPEVVNVLPLQIKLAVECVRNRHKQVSVWHLADWVSSTEGYEVRRWTK